MIRIKISHKSFWKGHALNASAREKSARKTGKGTSFTRAVKVCK